MRATDPGKKSRERNTPKLKASGETRERGQAQLFTSPLVPLWDRDPAHRTAPSPGRQLLYVGSPEQRQTRASLLTHGPAVRAPQSSGGGLPSTPRGFSRYLRGLCEEWRWAGEEGVVIQVPGDTGCAMLTRLPRTHTRAHAHTRVHTHTARSPRQPEWLSAGSGTTVRGKSPGGVGEGGSTGRDLQRSSGGCGGQPSSMCADPPFLHFPPTPHSHGTKELTASSAPQRAEDT